MWDNTPIKSCSTANNIECDSLNACRGIQKLMKIEVIHNKKLNQQLNTRDKYQGAEIKINILFQMQKKWLSKFRNFSGNC